jgi:cellulose synthase/poly-beta-1,6-N-acetylglucosamine synthase-like glycosyltransferase
MFPFILSVVSFLLCCGIAVEVLRGFRRLTRLEHVAPGTGALPRVSIIFGARDEQEAIAEAVRSHVAQDYPDFEVIAVDDHSSDQTPQLVPGHRRACAGAPQRRPDTCKRSPWPRCCLRGSLNGNCSCL